MNHRQDAAVVEMLETRQMLTAIVAANDTMAVPMNMGSATPTSLDVLANDTGGTGTFSITAIGAIPYGSAVVQQPQAQGGHQTISFTPSLGFSGTEAFSYSISDTSGNTGTATVSLMVGATSATPTGTTTAPTTSSGSGMSPSISTMTAGADDRWNGSIIDTASMGSTYEIDFDWDRNGTVDSYFFVNSTQTTFAIAASDPMPNTSFNVRAIRENSQGLPLATGSWSTQTAPTAASTSTMPGTTGTSPSTGSGATPTSGSGTNPTSGPASQSVGVVYPYGQGYDPTAAYNTAVQNMDTQMAANLAAQEARQAAKYATLKANTDALKAAAYAKLQATLTTLTAAAQSVDQQTAAVLAQVNQ